MRLTYLITFLFLISLGLAESDIVIGIDLGTTYSCVGVWRNGHIEIIANEQGNRITASYVSFKGNERLVGDAAKNQAASNPTNTVFDVKRLIGRSYNDKQVQADKKLLPYTIVNKDNKPAILVEYQGSKHEFSAEEISAMILVKMKEIAESFLGTKVTQAVVTVPAYFNDAQRQATKDAGKIAKLDIRRIINEPTAAAIAYGLDKKVKDQNILVFDLGGGTFDVSLLNIADGVFAVLATSGDTHLGGEDFDHKMMNWAAEEFKRLHGKNIINDKKAMTRLRAECEKTKRTLSSVTQASIEVQNLYDGIDFILPISRAKFEDLCKDLFTKTKDPIKKVLLDGKLDKSEIDEIVMVGGSTRIPKIYSIVKDFFDGKEPKRDINPDEAIAYGAAVQAGILGGDSTSADILLLDVTPLTLGIETHPGHMTPIVPRNTVIPTKKEQVFSTYQDQQTTVSIQVFQGERTMARDNIELGKFELTDIPPAPRGVPQIKVIFEVDANSILSVKAIDQGTGNERSIVVTADKTRHSTEEVELMIKKAEEFADYDKKIRETIDAKIDLEGFALTSKSQVKNKELLGKHISEQDAEAVIKACDEAISWLSSNREPEKDEIIAQKDALEAVVNPIFTKLYQKAGASSGGAKPEDDDEVPDHDDL